MNELNASSLGPAAPLDPAIAQHVDITAWPYTGRACRALGCHPNTLRGWGERGLIRHFRTPSGKFRWDVADALSAGLREQRNG